MKIQIKLEDIDGVKINKRARLLRLTINGYIRSLINYDLQANNIKPLLPPKKGGRKPIAKKGGKKDA